LDTSLSAALTGGADAATLPTMRVSLFAAAALIALVACALVVAGFFDGHF
jgi:hypothetical protein